VSKLRLGDGLEDTTDVGPMINGPALDNTKLDQIAALPLGGRVKVNPWDDKAEMVKTAPVAITSARDKMPFEVTPFFPRLARYGATAAPAAAPATSAANSGSGN